MFDADLLGRSLAEVIKDEVAKATAPLMQRIKDLEERPQPEATSAIPTEEFIRGIEARALAAGHDGAEAALAMAGTPETRAAELDAAVARHFEANPVRDGKDAEPASNADIFEAVKTYLTEFPPAAGRDADPVTAEQLAAAVAEHLAANPIPAGKDARPEQIAEAVAAYIAANPPAPGKDAEPITEDQIAEAVARALEPQEGALNPVAAQVQRWMEANPVPAGKDGRDGIDGKDGADGLDGKDGADGVGLASALIDKDGCLVVTTTRGDTIPLGRVVGSDGRDGEQGARGRDGLDLRHFDTAVSEDGRIITFSLEDDDLRVTHELQLDTLIYRGVFRAGQTYQRGDAVTWAGSLWHCNAETIDKPLEGSATWTLCVKRGRDGKDGGSGK